MTTGHTPYPHLFSPFQLGPCALRNRVVIPGHSMIMSSFEPGVAPRFHDYLVRRARGGVALVGIESAPVHESTVNFSAANVFSDDAVPSLRRLADAIHREGAKLSIILWHGGHNVSHRSATWTLAPSPIPGFRSRDNPKVMTKRDIAMLVDAYGAAARRCREAGVDVLEVQTATDYLLGHFMSHRLNWRTDEYGGSLENRMRFVCEVLQAVRSAAGPKIAVGVRTSVKHFIPGDPDDYDIDDSLPSIRHLDERKLIDYVSVMTGSHWSFNATIPPMTTPPAPQAAEAAQFKAALSVPVTVAGQIRTPAVAERILASGQADLIAMARTLIADPDWVRKAQDGREPEIRPCINCNQGCIGFVSRRMAGSCILNPQVSREASLPDPQPAPQPKRVAVIGAGPGGLETARRAAESGHQVTVYEASGRIGGQFYLAAHAPYREEMRPALDWWANELRRLQVRIVLNRRVQPGDPPEADAVIWAIGAQPAINQVWRIRPFLRDGIPGTAGLPHGRDVMAGTADAKGRVLIIDEEGGWPTVSLAETLAVKPGIKEVVVVTSEATLGGPDLDLSGDTGIVARRTRERGIVLRANTLVDAVEGQHAVLNTGERLGPFDTIILSTGTHPLALPDDAVMVGDCLTPRGVFAATFDAARVTRDL